MRLFYVQENRLHDTLSESGHAGSPHSGAQSGQTHEVSAALTRVTRTRKIKPNQSWKSDFQKFG